MAKAFGTLIRAGGTIEPIEGHGATFSLEELQRCVGGYIEVVRVQDKEKAAYLIVNEEGLILQLPLNPIASEIAQQRIVGDAVLVERRMLE